MIDQYLKKKAQVVCIQISSDEEVNRQRVAAVTAKRITCKEEPVDISSDVSKQSQVFVPVQSVPQKKAIQIPAQNKQSEHELQLQPCQFSVTKSVPAQDVQTKNNAVDAQKQTNNNSGDKSSQSHIEIECQQSQNKYDYSYSVELFELDKANKAVGKQIKPTETQLNNHKQLPEKHVQNMTSVNPQMSKKQNKQFPGLERLILGQTMASLIRRQMKA